MTESKPLRNLTKTVNFRIYVPDVSVEEARKNVPWVMRLEVPRAVALEVVEIEQPSLGPGLVAVLHSAAPTKTVGYAYMEHKPEPETEPVFITSMFPGMDIPWSDASFEVGTLWCRPIGWSTHSGVPLMHVEIGLCYPHMADQAAINQMGDELEKEIREAGYLVVPPKEYDLHKKLVLLQKAHAERVADAQKVEEPVQGEG